MIRMGKAGLGLHPGGQLKQGGEAADQTPTTRGASAPWPITQSWGISTKDRMDPVNGPGQAVGGSVSGSANGVGVGVVVGLGVGLGVGVCVQG